MQAYNADAGSCWIAGVSFGAWIAMQLLMRRPEIEGFISVAPPANLYDFTFLAPCPSSGLMVNGAKDRVVPTESVRGLVDRLKTQKGIVIDHQTVPDANHFFEGRMDGLMEVVDAYLDKRLGKKKKRNRRPNRLPDRAPDSFTTLRAIHRPNLIQAALVSHVTGRPSRMSTTKSEFLNELKARGYVHQVTDEAALDRLASSNASPAISASTARRRACMSAICSAS